MSSSPTGSEEGTDMVYGRNPVLALLESDVVQLVDSAAIWSFRFDHREDEAAERCAVSDGVKLLESSQIMSSRYVVAVFVD